MTPLETGLIAISTGFLAALITGAGVYVKLARQTLTRNEHEKECQKATIPLREDIKEIKDTCRRIEDKNDDSTKDLSKDIKKIIFQLNKINGGD